MKKLGIGGKRNFGAGGGGGGKIQNEIFKVKAENI